MATDNGIMFLLISFLIRMAYMSAHRSLSAFGIAQGGKGKSCKLSKLTAGAVCTSECPTCAGADPEVSGRPAWQQLQAQVQQLENQMAARARRTQHPQYASLQDLPAKNCQAHTAPAV